MHDIDYHGDEPVITTPINPQSRYDTITGWAIILIAVIVTAGAYWGIC